MTGGDTYHYTNKDGCGERQNLQKYFSYLQLILVFYDFLKLNFSFFMNHLLCGTKYERIIGSSCFSTSRDFDIST